MKKKVLITGGSGTVGISFIKEFYERYHFVSYSRNEKKQITLKRNFDDVKLYLGSVENRHELINAFIKIKPDIVIHAAALKHIETGEKQPSQTVKVNILGSLNVIEASRSAGVPVTIGISSDKACGSNNVYGYTKIIMERLFLEADDDKNRFACCRFGNVAGSHGSVIPFWLTLAKENKPLLLTDADMNRFMFSPHDSACLIQKAIDIAEAHHGGFLLIKKMKSINMLELAKQISSNITIVGKRFGENLNETLISVDELPFSREEGKYITIRMQKNLQDNQLSKELNTLYAEKMDLEEINDLIQNVKENLNTTLLTTHAY